MHCTDLKVKMMTESPQKSGNGSHLEPLDYLRGVESSTCLLLPTSSSPSPLDFKHPLSDEMTQSPLLMLNNETSELQNRDSSGGDSSSSADSNSVIHDPVSAQLINNISMLDYQTLTKNGDIMVGEVEDGKLNGNVNIGSRKLPNFVNWNWPLIRTFLLWVMVSGLMACIAAIAAMVVLIPKTCNPDLPWYQSKVFYEVSPANFQDSNNDGIGDLKGLIAKLNDIQELHVTAIRLNNIFEEKSQLKIDSRLGTLDDFQSLVLAVHVRNMSLILDMPVKSLASPLTSTNMNSTQTVLLANDTLISYFDETSAAIAFWSRAQNVDGFYLKNLENYVDEPYFGKSLQLWKQIIGFGKILIAAEYAMNKASGNSLNILLNRIDLIDIQLDLTMGIDGLKHKINEMVSGPLWAKPHYPWTHWTVGKDDKISSSISNNTLTLMAMQFILPGTVNIFYIHEIDLGNIVRDNLKSAPSRAFNEQTIITSENSLNENTTSMDTGNRFIETLKNFAEVHINTPTIALRAIIKEGNVLKNTAIRETDNSNLVVIERWYPRRNTCVFVGNLGNESITTDLSTMFYGGTVIASTNSSFVGQIVYFNEITFAPNSAIILRLEK